MTIKSNGNQAFTVPVNAEGQAFLDQLAKYLHRQGYSMKKRGRGSRVVNGHRYNRDFIPLGCAKWIAVYLTSKRNVREQKEHSQYVNKLYNENIQLKAEIERLKAFRAKSQTIPVIPVVTVEHDIHEPPVANRPTQPVKDDSYINFLRDTIIFHRQLEDFYSKHGEIMNACREAEYIGIVKKILKQERS